MVWILIQGLLLVVYLIGIWWCMGVYDAFDDEHKDTLYTVCFLLATMLWPIMFLTSIKFKRIK